MIVVDFELWSARTGDKTSCGLILIDNRFQYADGTADYRVRAYRKGTRIEHIRRGGAQPIRTAAVLRYAKKSKPVWNLMLKALQALGYDQ